MNIEWEKLSSVSGLGIVVEDDPILRVLMVEILAEIGLHSLDFETADDALIYLMSRSNDCSLVIADHGLPGQLQGAEFIALMKTKWPPSLRSSLPATRWMSQQFPPQRRTCPNLGLWKI